MLGAEEKMIDDLLAYFLGHIQMVDIPNDKEYITIPWFDIKDNCDYYQEYAVLKGNTRLYPHQVVERGIRLINTKGGRVC